MQIRLIYASTASTVITEAAIKDILTTATKHNSQNNITGMLCYDEKYFFQCLEGERTEINLLYNSIIRDIRHKDIFLLDYVESNIRIFKEWSMVGIDLKDEDTNFLIKKYTPKGFHPQRLSASQAADLIEHLGTYLKGKIII